MNKEKKFEETDGIKKSISETTRAISGNENLKIKFSADPSGDYGEVIKLPQISKEPNESEILKVRGTADSLALQARFKNEETYTRYAPSVEQAKEINEQLNKKQSSTQANISSEIDGNDEEPLPINDPFAGDDGTASTIVSDVSSEKELVNLSKYKLVGVFNGTIKSFATFVDEGGEFITLETQEELSNGLKLVDVNIKEAIFQKGENSFVSLNFKNQIRERDEF